MTVVTLLLLTSYFLPVLLEVLHYLIQYCRASTVLLVGRGGISNRRGPTVVTVALATVVRYSTVVSRNPPKGDIDSNSLIVWRPFWADLSVLLQHDAYCSLQYFSSVLGVGIIIVELFPS